MCLGKRIVLKFGGSVIDDDVSLRRITHEVYRWRRDGYRIVVVVSAQSGRTEELLAGAALTHPQARPRLLAAWLSAGENETAGRLGLALDRAGIPACVLNHASVGLRAEGPCLDADLVSLEARAIECGLGQDEVVVVPGFLALDAEDRTVTLGRGGADLTALFLAAELDADRCRLVKDVDGLYESDPAAECRPLRYEHACWEDALATDGTVLQKKAMKFARGRQIRFEVGNFNAIRPSTIGCGPSEKVPPPSPSRPLRVALLGLGTVGLGTHSLLTELEQECEGAEIEVCAVLVRDRDKPRDLHVCQDLFVHSLESCFERSPDVIVEAIGGIEPAASMIEASLRAGCHVVTANKAVTALHGARFRNLAQSCGVEFCFSAAVGGSMPILERFESIASSEVVSVRGVLNGTTNFVLGELSQGSSLDSALDVARTLGFAEESSDRDLLGYDCADKLCLIAQSLGEADLRPGEVAVSSSPEQMIQFGVNGGATKQVGTLIRASGGIEARVELCELSPDDELSKIHEADNGAEIVFRDGRKHNVRGQGAGRWPTAEAVVGDVFQIARSSRSARATSVQRI